MGKYKKIELKGIQPNQKWKAHIYAMVNDTQEYTEDSFERDLKKVSRKVKR